MLISERENMSQNNYCCMVTFTYNSFAFVNEQKGLEECISD